MWLLRFNYKLCQHTFWMRFICQDSYHTTPAMLSQFWGMTTLTTTKQLFQLNHTVCDKLIAKLLHGSVATNQHTQLSSQILPVMVSASLWSSLSRLDASLLTYCFSWCVGLVLAGDCGCCLWRCGVWGLTEGGRPVAEAVGGKAVVSSLADFHTSAAQAIGQCPHTAEHSGQEHSTQTGS